VKPAPEALEEFMKYKAKMEELLTAALRLREPLLSQVRISDTGEFAQFQLPAPAST
jgi:hypothetical protein